jgi:predicted dehydrogenase
MGIKIGLAGAGHLGAHYARILAAGLAGSRLTGIFDQDQERARELGALYHIKTVASLPELLGDADAICCCVSTVSHYALAAEILSAGKDILIEKPLCAASREAEQLLANAELKRVILQVGHIERFNPAYEFLRTLKLQPGFLDIDRLACFNVRGTDVSVIHDLMIHDLDLLLDLLGSDPVEIRASGVKVISSTFDIANARLEFAGGIAANLTASRISQQELRKFRLFQPNGYYSLDLAAKQVDCYEVDGESMDFSVRMDFPTLPDGRRIRYYRPDLVPANALENQIRDFIRCCETRQKPRVSGLDGLRALKLAEAVVKACH